MDGALVERGQADEREDQATVELRRVRATAKRHDVSRWDYPLLVLSDDAKLLVRVLIVSCASVTVNLREVWNACTSDALQNETRVHRDRNGDAA